MLAVVILLALNRLGLLDPPEVSLTTTRVTGEDPISAAAAVARESHPGGAPTVILAGTQALADGVVATGLAGALRAPIVLSDADQLAPATRDLMRELEVERAILIGGSSALGEGMAATLAGDLGIEVVRIAGSSRFDTAGLVADMFAEAADPAVVDGLRTALIVPAEDVPAGLEAGSLAAYIGDPLPVLISQNGLLPDPTIRA
ncbi:MAG TPA: cell wall-binding repeat-containing protein, partial [Euzebya sp.]|nr:cell wall-binding repeat-containing protein [Euzebya sp.]